MEALAPAQLRQILASFDRALVAVNENYGFFRADRLLVPPRLSVMQKGWFDRIAADHMARSGRDSQFKPALLVSRPEHPEMVEHSLDWPAEDAAQWRRVGA